MPTRPASPYHHGDLRQAMLQAAAEVLEELGLERFTLRECARRAGVSHGAPAHHFGDVRGLLTALVAQGFEQLLSWMDEHEAVALRDAFSQLAANGSAYLAFALAHRALFQLMFRSDRVDWQDAALAQAGERAHARLKAHIAAVSNAPKLLDARVAFAWSMVHGLATLTLENQLFAGDAKGRSASALALWDLFVQLMKPGLTAPANALLPSAPALATSGHRGAKLLKRRTAGQAAHLKR